MRYTVVIDALVFGYVTWLFPSVGEGTAVLVLFDLVFAYVLDFIHKCGKDNVSTCTVGECCSEREAFI